MKFAKRMERFNTGIFSVLAELKRKETAQGKKIVDLSVGTPNIPPARHIIDALLKSAQNSKNYVYALDDTAELQEAVEQWYRRRYGVAIDPKTEMTSLLGSQDGLSHLGLTIADPGDLVLVPDPCYPIFADGPALAGAELYRMPQTRENGYRIDLRAIPEEVARRAKLMVVSYPNNPVTSVAPESFYRELVAFAKKYDIIVLHDNAYSELVFDGVKCGSFLQYDGAKDVGIEFNSLSKTYGLAGARIGFALGNKDVIGMLKALKSNLDYGMFLPIQKAAVAALTGPQDCVETTRRAYEKRRDVLVDGLNAVGWKIEKPKATMFVWAEIPQPFVSSEKFTLELLKRAGVLVTPGSAFGPSGEGHVRIALVQDEDEMRCAVRRIQESGILEG
ncbi:MAG: aminotransferase class I/II-fold pyridoxal phosphate-dependent enzyme [Oscillospiraceae bacterium]|jgi:LL-diaminopimelate aminotransferase|nr:aminotransferase class I/II-fold pyridoxal phosphate-dependent enzyme [Oscillospiraceae bacterium]MCI1990964.1 aminotransferase class I/II-fold pyridoxal phosphate-dependent enzyme [Oscillospiraceae bacterium]MCI2034534.1 aminotransferase class I/II-fold pyridoxal phosphate-dependent enzyme [Oscillospiraceae bacterium]